MRIAPDDPGEARSIQENVPNGTARLSAHHKTAPVDMGTESDTIYVDLSAGDDRSYPVVFGDLPDLPNAMAAAGIETTECVVITDSNVAPLYGWKTADRLADTGWTPRTFVVEAGEASKSLSRFSEIVNFALERPLSRLHPVLAVGGGVVGDLAGFVAASLLRGLPLVHIPTTLVAQVDSAIGGKTGINHSAGKNLIGAFHQPQLVFVDTSVLSTLPQREWSAGLAEVVKVALIGDEAFFRYLLRKWDAVEAREPASVQRLVRRATELKAEIVSEDEREQGVRSYLNLGHTFGHALETALGYGTILHGEAVAIGIRAALHASVALYPDFDAAPALELVNKLSVPKLDAVPDVDELIDLMRFDKKQRGSIRLVLLDGMAHPVVRAHVTDNVLRKAWSFALEPIR
jgi:3-dehydroquinate synthase